MDTTTGQGVGPATVVRARIAVSIVFFVLGCGAGLWAVHIPIVAVRLAIDPGVIGLALLAGAIGAVGTMPLTGIALGRFGSRPTTAALALVFPVLAPFLVFSPSTPFLFVSLFLFGAAMGGCDVAMNTQAAEVEAARGRPTMSSFHGFFSVGALVGSGLGGLIIAVGWGNGRGATIVAALLLALSVYAALNLWPNARPIAHGSRFALPPVAVLTLGAITFLAFAAEGGVTDWSALFLSTVKQTGPAAAATGLALFSFAMTICRLTGDWLVARLGNVPMVVGGGVLTAIGMIAAVAAPWPAVSALAFAVVGLGIANVVPVAISAATRVKGVPPGIGVAAVTSMGYAGFLIVPPVLGFAAKWYGLSASLLIVAAMGIAIAAFASAVRR